MSKGAPTDGFVEEYDEAAPRPGALIESLRSFGYSPETAIADLVDNSLSAGAGQIKIQFRWAEAKSFVAVVDDGHGMTETQLVEAMRPGSVGPLEHREASDLGRFGLGLKTASFSQARELTVLSRSDGELTAVRRWDLDHVATVGQWRLLRSPAQEALEFVSDLDRTPGTAVVWSQCDHLVRDLETDVGKAEDRFMATAVRVSRHLGMTFHRFMTGRNAIRISVNDNPVIPWDPILRHPATQLLGGHVEVHPYGDSTVVVGPYVLPHRSKLNEEEQALGAGLRGWTSQQGFYVYRNDRLMVAGDWLGMGITKDEHTKLARITVDFESSLDLAWQIDVKKSTARPPGALMLELRRIATYTRRAAELVYRYRGGPVRKGNSVGGEPLVLAWQEYKTREGEYRLRVNRSHPFLVDLMAKSKDDKRVVTRVLSFVEETIPTNWIGIRMAETLDHEGGLYRADQRAVADLLDYAIDSLTKAGTPLDEVIEQLSLLEPFAQYPALLAVARERETP